MRLAVVLLVLATVGSGCLQSSQSKTDSGTANDPLVAPPRPEVDAAALLADLRSFASEFPQRRDNLPTHEGARGWLLEQFASFGLTTWRQNFTRGGLEQANVAGIHWGAVRDQWVVVGGHYDTTHNDCTPDSTPPVNRTPLPPVQPQPIPSPCALHALSQGAYDDGSGTLHMVHLAKAFANVSTHYTVAFVAYDGEERGLEGASAFAAAVVGEETPFGAITLRAVLDLDMFGITWPGTNAPIQVLDNSPALYGLADGLRKELGVPDDMWYRKDLVTLGSSDFQVFFDLGVPTVFFSSDFGKFTPPGSPASPPYAFYPFWHLADTYDSMEAAAGGPEALLAGFQTAAGLEAGVLHRLATDPGLDLGGQA